MEVRDGKIIGKKAGTTTVRATAYANPEAFDACRVTVKNVPVTQLIIEPEEFEISLNAPYKVEYRVEPENASDKSVTWESSKPDIIQVDPHTGDLIGKVVTEDWVTVTGTANGGSNITKTCKVKVIGLKKAQQIFIPVSVTLNLNEKQTLAVSYEPEDATDRQVIWESNDDEIVQVSDKGVLTARQAGDAEITVSLKNDRNIKAVCKVKVLPRVVTTGIALIKSLKLGIGANYTFVAQALPENATDQLLAWRVEEITNNAVAFDNLTQTVTGKAAGTAKLIVSLAIGFFREVDGALYHGCLVLGNHAFAVEYLQNDVALRQGDVLNVVHTHRVQTVDIVFCVFIHRGCHLVLTCGHPCFLASLSVFLGQCLEVGAVGEGGVDRVCGFVCSLWRSSTHLNLAIFHRVGQLNLRYKLNEVERIVLFVLNRTIHRAYTHRVETCCDVAWISIFANGQAQIVYERRTLAYHVSWVGSLGQFLRVVGELLFQASLVLRRSLYLYVDVLDIACFYILLKARFQFFVFGFEV